MEISPDFRDLLLALRNEKARFLVVGAHAVMYYTEPRYTKDLDVWVQPTAANAARVWEALRVFGAPVRDVPESEFMNEDVVYAIGVEPHRIDILMSIDGLKFDAAWSHRVRTTYGDVAIAVPSRPDLIKAKLAAGRPQDLLDVATLRTKPKALSQLRARSKKSKRK